MKYCNIILFFTLSSWVFMQECPPADTIAVTPSGNSYSFPYLNNWDNIEVMTWNIKDFPKHTYTLNYVNEIISETLPDIICFQEIEDDQVYSELAASIPTHSFIRTSYGGGGYTNLGIAVRNDCAEITDYSTLFNSDGSAFTWRYPLMANIDWHCGTSYLNLQVINVHFKAYDEGFEQRLEASGIISNYIDSNPNLNIVVAGDFNDQIDDSQNTNSFWPLIINDDAYFVTTPIAENSYYNSYPWGPYAGFIDHILISSNLFGQNASGNITTVRLDDYMGSTTYQDYISDHRPVLWSIPVEAVELNMGLVINEIMQNPAAVSDAAGEWIEITNISNETINLHNLILRDDDGEQHVISENVDVSPGSYIVLGAKDDFTLNGYVTVDYEYSGFTLSNLWDEVILEHPSGVILDEVHYDNGETFPDESGKSMMLMDPNLDNSLGDRWMVADVVYGAGDYGTPGSENYPNDCLPPGDMNGDDVLNVIDVVILANCVLAGTCESNCHSDLNSDGDYNVLDIITLVNCILGGNCGE